MHKRVRGSSKLHTIKLIMLIQSPQGNKIFKIQKNLLINQLMFPDKLRILIDSYEAMSLMRNVSRPRLRARIKLVDKRPDCLHR